MTSSSVGEKSLTCQEHLFAEKTKEPDEGWVAAQITRANNCLFYVDCPARKLFERKKKFPRMSQIKVLSLARMMIKSILKRREEVIRSANNGKSVHWD